MDYSSKYRLCLIRSAYCEVRSEEKLKNYHYFAFTLNEKLMMNILQCGAQFHGECRTREHDSSQRVLQVFDCQELCEKKAKGSNSRFIHLYLSIRISAHSKLHPFAKSSTISQIPISISSTIRGVEGQKGHSVLFHTNINWV